MQRIELAPDYEISRVIRGGWQLAAGHGEVHERRPGGRHGGLRRRRHHHLRLRRHLHRRRGADRPLPPALPRCARRRRAVAHQGAHQVRARPRHAEAHQQELCRGRDRPVAAAAEARPARPRAVPLVGLCRAAMARNGAVAERAQAVRQDPQGERHQLRHRPHAAHGQCRRAADLDAGAILAARFQAGQAHGRGGARQTASRCSATARWQAASSATAGSAGRSPWISRTAR